jgi:SAM-dependent methyltransferase
VAHPAGGQRVGQGGGRRRLADEVGLDPSPELLRMAGAGARSAPFPVDLVEGSAEELWFGNATFDTVVTTWTLCSVRDPGLVLREMQRVLKPGGELLFVEHGLAPDRGVAAWQQRLTPLWKRIGGGCHLDRDVAGLTRAAGWDLLDLHTSYMRGPRPFTFMYEGRAGTSCRSG